MKKFILSSSLMKYLSLTSLNNYFFIIKYFKFNRMSIAISLSYKNPGVCLYPRGIDHASEYSV